MESLCEFEEDRMLRCCRGIDAGQAEESCVALMSADAT